MCSLLEMVGTCSVQETFKSLNVRRTSGSNHLICMCLELQRTSASQPEYVRLAQCVVCCAISNFFCIAWNEDTYVLLLYSPHSQQLWIGRHVTECFSDTAPILM